MTLKNKIKELLPSSDVQHIVIGAVHSADENDMVRISCYAHARDLIAERYAEKYGVTWEKFVEYCSDHYKQWSRGVEIEERGGDTFVYLFDRTCVFVSDGHCRIDGGYPVSKKTLVLWGRYLEGLGDDKE